MLRYVSNLGQAPAVDFEMAILDGYAPDGGLYVPEKLPKISTEMLVSWQGMTYLELAFEILSLFIDRSAISAVELKKVLHDAYAPFEKEEVVPLYKMSSRENTFIMELFHGPTLSFKDVGMAFLVNLIHFFLERKQQHLTIMVGTTGDTGPATAYFAAEKATLDAWILYPKGMITQEQERQMTTIKASNIHPVGVHNCPEGGDDLDVVISKLYANRAFKEKMNLSSVNSINWGRVMMQTVHYFYGYLKIVDQIGEKIQMAVPCGAFGNLCAGTLAREMGLPVETFICATNQNATLHRIFSEGVFSKHPIVETISSAIDILIPVNFWRYLYFITGQNAENIRAWQKEFEERGIIRFDAATFSNLKKGMVSASISDEDTLSTIRTIYDQENYLLDPHGAVALAAANTSQNKATNQKLICLTTAHPAKFPNVIQQALQTENLPVAAKHRSIEMAREEQQKMHLYNHNQLHESLIKEMENNWEIHTGEVKSGLN